MLCYTCITCLVTKCFPLYLPSVHIDDILKWILISSKPKTHLHHKIINLNPPFLYVHNVKPHVISLQTHFIVIFFSQYCRGFISTIRNMFTFVFFPTHSLRTKVYKIFHKINHHPINPLTITTFKTILHKIIFLSSALQCVPSSISCWLLLDNPLTSWCILQYIVAVLLSHTGSNSLSLLLWHSN
jgi:hypothetical protein